MFSLQLDESVDITGKSQLLVFGRFIYENEIIEQFLFCQPLKTTLKGQYIFNLINICFNLND